MGVNKYASTFPIASCNKKSVCYDIKPVRSGRKRGNLIGKFLYAMTMLPGKNNAHN